jgi:hypothetical protein
MIGLLILFAFAAGWLLLRWERRDGLPLSRNEAVRRMLER